MTWNKKNQQFELSCGLRPSTVEMCQWVLRKTNSFKPTEKVIDIREFNEYIGKYRLKGEYDRKTIKEAIAQLNEKTYGWIVIVKSYTWSVHKILIRPVDFAISQKSQNSEKLPKLNRGNPMFSDAHKDRLVKQQQQDISKIDSLLTNVGLKYDRDALSRIYRLAGKKIESVVNAIELMLYRHSSTEIPKPHGFIISCLTHGWQDGFDLYYQPELPKLKGVRAIADYVRDICSRNSLRYDRVSSTA